MKQFRCCNIIIIIIVDLQGSLFLYLVQKKSLSLLLIRAHVFKNLHSAFQHGRVNFSGANSQISWGGKIFYGVEEFFFLRGHAKSPVSAPTIEVNSCTKMY